MGLPVWSTINYGQGPRAGSTSPRAASAEPTASRRSPIRRRPARVGTRMANGDENNRDTVTIDVRPLRRPPNPSPTWRREYIRRIAEQTRDTTASDNNSGSTQTQLLPTALAAQFTHVYERIDGAIAQASRIEAAYTARPPEADFSSHSELVAALRRSANFRSDAQAHRRTIVGYERQAVRGELTVQPTTTAMTVREVSFEMRDIEARVIRELDRVKQAFLPVGGVARAVLDMIQLENSSDEPSRDVSEVGFGSQGNWPLRENSLLSLNATLSDNVASLAAATADRYPASFEASHLASPTLAEITSLIPLNPPPSFLRREISSTNRESEVSRSARQRPGRTPPPALLASGQTETEGLGDRNRSPSLEGNEGTRRDAEQVPNQNQNAPQNDPRAWDSLLATVAPDDILPSADSTFTAATASFEAGSTSGILQHPGARSGTTSGSSSGPGSGISSRSSWTTQITAASSNSANERENEDDCDWDQELQERLNRYPINPYYRPSDRLRLRRRHERSSQLGSQSNVIIDDSGSSSSSSNSRVNSQTRIRRRQRSALAQTSPNQPSSTTRNYTLSESRDIEDDIRSVALRRLEAEGPIITTNNETRSELHRILHDMWPGNPPRVRQELWALVEEADDAGLSNPEERAHWMISQARQRYGPPLPYQTRLRRMGDGFRTPQDRILPRMTESNRRSSGPGLLPRRRTTEMEGSAPSRNAFRQERLVMERVESPGPMSDDDDLHVDMDDVEMRMVVDGEGDELDILDQVFGSSRPRRTVPGMPWMNVLGQNPLLSQSEIPSGTRSVVEAEVMVPSVLDMSGSAPTSAVREERIVREGDESRDD